jgi:hypothetical protein
VCEDASLGVTPDVSTHQLAGQAQTIEEVREGFSFLIFSLSVS